jgi:hypothetical protein
MDIKILNMKNTYPKFLIVLIIFAVALCGQAPEISLNAQTDSETGREKSSQPISVRDAGSPEELEVLAKPFIGITTDGQRRKGLFPTKSTGVSTRSLQSAVNSFLFSLNVEQEAKCTFTVDDNEWRRWHNTEIYQRDGIGLFELNELQKDLAFGILEKSLSLQGLEKAGNVMKMEEHLAYLVKAYVESGQFASERFERLGGDKFYLTFMGTPSDTEPWGWQLDGHHLVINYFVLGDQVVMTPTLMGTEPTYAKEGPYSGLRTFEQEEIKGFRFYSSLSSAQKEKATIQATKKQGNFIRTQAFRDNVVLAYSGIPGSDLSESQQALLLDLIAEYVGNMQEGHAQIKMQEVKSHLKETWFSWIGPDDDQSPIYYRVYSPVILIEFEHKKPVFLWDRNKPRPGPTKNHIHTIVRTPNGNDYGKDLLRQHLERYPH